MTWADVGFLLGGYVFGVVVCWLIFRPSKAFNDGFRAARAFFSDWHKGFHQGFESGYLCRMKEEERREEQ